MLATAQNLHAEDAKKITFLLVVNKKIDHSGTIATAQNEKLLTDAKPHIVLSEPTSAKVVVAQKRLLKTVLKAKNIAKHSAFPERETSAIHLLIDTIARVRNNH